MSNHDPNTCPNRQWVIEAFKALIEGLPITDEQKRLLRYRLLPFEECTTSVRQLRAEVAAILARCKKDERSNADNSN